MTRKLTRQQKWRREHPARYLAHLYTATAKRLGVLVPQPCETCGNAKSEAHHPDYEKPGQVIWLCRRCHKSHHAKEAANGQ